MWCCRQWALKKWSLYLFLVFFLPFSVPFLSFFHIYLSTFFAPTSGLLFVEMLLRKRLSWRIWNSSSRISNTANLLILQTLSSVRETIECEEWRDLPVFRTSPSLSTTSTLNRYPLLFWEQSSDYLVSQWSLSCEWSEGARGIRFF